MKSSEIKDLLAKKHAGEVFVTECKTGSAGSRIMDAWTMKKSWANQCYTGYEIKVSRADFIGDNKWTDYLPCCDRFYFVCPCGLIDKTEVGENAGLMYVSRNAKMVRIVKKAPPIKHDILAVNDVMSYILMNRVKICDSTFGKKVDIEQSNISFWKNWLENKDHCRVIGRSVSKELWYRVESKIQAVQAENEGLVIQNEKLSKIKDFLTSIGIDYERRWVGLRAIDGAMFGEIREIISSIRNVENSVSSLKITLEGKLPKDE